MLSNRPLHTATVVQPYDPGSWKGSNFLLHLLIVHLRELVFY